MYNIYKETNVSVYTKTILNVKLYWKEHCYIGKLAAHKSLNVNIDSFECRLW